MNRRYRLKILQKKKLDNVETYLVDLLQGKTDCSILEIIPRKKSNRELPKPGIKWIGGIITLKHDPNCFREFADRTQYNEFFKIAIISLNSNI